MKSLKSLHTKEIIYWTKGLSLLTSVDTRTNLLFYGMITRTKSYIFTVIFFAVFPLEPTFWSAQFIFCIYGFQNRNRVAQSDGFIGECCGEYFLWRQHENDITFSFGYYYLVTFSLYVIFLTEDCCKAWNFKYQNLVFLFLSCVIILLFSPIYMVIEHSFMNCSYTAKIYIYIYITFLENVVLLVFVSHLSWIHKSQHNRHLLAFVRKLMS